MTEVVTKTEQVVVGEPEETVESLKAKLTELETTVTSLNGEAAKHKTLRRAAEKERDVLKTKVKVTDQSDQDYKALWTTTNDKLTKTLERAKKADINTALSAQFGKTKVASDRFDAALKLVDTNLVEWDEDAGVDSHSVVAAVAKLKSEHGFLFETTVNRTDVKQPGDGGSQNTLTRSIFDTLSSADKAAKIKAKVKIID
jgi:hypothetical protein